MNVIALTLDVGEILETTMTTVSTDMLSALGKIAPVAIGVIGAGIALSFGIKWFKKLTNKA